MSAYVAAALRRAVRERFTDRCAYCRTAEGLTATQFEIEHIVPRAAGGVTGTDNLCLACPMCNRFKSDATTAADPTTGIVVALFHPHRERWPDHFGWAADGTEIAGLTPIGRATAWAFRMNRPAMIRVRRLWVALGEHPPAA